MCCLNYHHKACTESDIFQNGFRKWENAVKGDSFSLLRNMFNVLNIPDNFTCDF